ncbi:MAG: trigger factor [Heliobacteriaceae bacterium]|nr:trigger factor [Heliobacteriaceae bacterium]
MKATVEKIDLNKVALEIEVDAVQLETAVQNVYKRVAAKMQIPGFRKGKAPRRVVELHYGKENLYNEALDQVVPEAFMEAVTEKDIEPVDRPEIEIIQIEAGQPLIFKATVVVKPEVILGEYKGIEYEPQPAVVQDEDVDRHLEMLQKRHAKLVALPEAAPAESGDIVLIDYEGFKAGIPFEGGKGTDFSLELGSNTFVPGFEDGLLGVLTGEERSVPVTFPEAYHAADLAGQDVEFKVSVKEIKRKDYAPIDDEFAKDVSDFDTLAELKEDVRKRLAESAEQASEQHKQNTVLEKVINNAEVTIPLVMIDNQVEYFLQDYGRRLSYQGIALENFLERTGQSASELRVRFRPEAEKTVKRELVVEAIAKQENMVVDDQELDTAIAKMAASYQQSPEAMRKLLENKGSIEGLRENLLAEKTVKFLADQAHEIASPVAG